MSGSGSKPAQEITICVLLKFESITIDSLIENLFTSRPTALISNALDPPALLSNAEFVIDGEPKARHWTWDPVRAELAMWSIPTCPTEVEFLTTENGRGFCWLKRTVTCDRLSWKSWVIMSMSMSEDDCVLVKAEREKSSSVWSETSSDTDQLHLCGILCVQDGHPERTVLDGRTESTLLYLLLMQSMLKEAG